VLDDLKQHAVEPKELEKAKNQEIAGVILGRETDEEKAVALAAATVIGKNPDLVNTEFQRFLNVTAADIYRVAKDYFVREHATILLITPAPAAQ
jgi:zinc protease